MQTIEDELFRLLELKSTDNWASSTRTPVNYDLIERRYPFGARLCYVPKQQERYVDLQSSRSIGIDIGDDLKAIIDKASSGIMDLHEHDGIRIRELERLGVAPKKGFAEIGFRIPRLMKHYTEHYGVTSIGYDIVPLSVMVGKHFGFDVRLHDVADLSVPIDLSGRDLAACYHVLEHVTEPMGVIKKLYDAMDDDAYLHVEVPIEPGVPRLQSAHLFAFQSDDLTHMLRDVGFTVESSSDETHAGGPTVERHLCRKKSAADWEW